MGFWNDKYEPYSLLDGDKVIANVSVNKIELLINGESKQAVQIGTVMTHPAYRGRGLSAFLMKQVLTDYQDADIFYLFANSTVLDFYPKFGFRSVEEHQAVMDIDFKGEGRNLQKLDMNRPDDSAFIYKLAESKTPVSNRFSTTNTADLLMFYCIYVFPQDIYYLAEEEVIILMKKEGTDLHLFDVISETKIDIERLVLKLASPETQRVYFHFTVDENINKITSEIYKSDEVLFVKTKEGLELPAQFKHPQTSQA